MNKDIVRAYLWQDVIRLGFSPAGTKNQKGWLHLYGKSLRNFLEVDIYPGKISSNGASLSATIDCSVYPGITFDCTIEHAQKFVVSLMYTPPVVGRIFMWSHDMDGQYFSFPNNIFLNHKQRKAAIKKMNLADLGDVIDSLIMHPLPHQHIESPLEDHHIRIGGGLLNPFLYLFHLRVQLCPNKDRRVAERDRLISLFETAMKTNSSIPPSEMMKIPNGN